jgi:hypothetical protein
MVSSFENFPSVSDVSSNNAIMAPCSLHMPHSMLPHQPRCLLHPHLQRHSVIPLRRTSRPSTPTSPSLMLPVWVASRESLSFPLSYFPSLCVLHV